LEKLGYVVSEVEGYVVLVGWVLLALETAVAVALG